MEVKAKLNYLRIAPRKVRLVADLIRGKKVKEARTLLEFTLKKAARVLKKLLDDSLANAKNNFHLDEETLVVSEIRVDEGPKLKRWRPRARGRAAEIQKKTSHITLVLKGEKKKKVEKEISKVKPKEEIKPAEEVEKKPKPKTPKREKKETSKKKEKISLRRIFKRKAF